MKMHPGLAIGLSLLFLAPAFGAEIDLSADPLWKALEIVPQCNLAAARPPRGPNGGSGTDATCTASCGSYASVSCTTSGTGSCTAVDRNCAVGERGRVTCGSTTTYCPPCETTCSATALCGGTTVSCTGTQPGTCSAVDQDCLSNQQGYVTCNSVTTFCPTTCENCDQYDTARCDYSWDSVRGCCVAGDFCPNSCWN